MIFRNQSLKKRFHVILIKPSKYDEEGFVIRYLRGVLPSNTLAAIYSLTKQATEQHKCLGEEVKTDITLFDELVDRVEPEKIARKSRRSYDRTLVCLVGVQTNQFPRTADLARQFVAAGVDVMVGGFHVSGAIAMEPNGNMPTECQDLIDAGVTLVKGEIEEQWGNLLADVWLGRRKPYYDIVEKPDMCHAPIPEVDRKYMKKFALSWMGTIDAGRGCPFNCSFCTIINVQGKKMRNRPAQLVLDQIRQNYTKGITYYFFTDDNFARNKCWEEVFDGIIRLRQEEQINITFMMQVDTLAHKNETFVEKAGTAGCQQVFIGMESINPKNLEAAGKKQNDVKEYEKMVKAWHSVGVHAHVGYIIGFPYDTRESVARDIQVLKHQIKVDQASFFMLCPLPGSEDHTNALTRGAWMASDYNDFDSFHPVTQHPLMSSEDWYQSYLDAWESFYDSDNIKAILQRFREKRLYWGTFSNVLWYKNSIMEGTHPMIAGFYRMRDRTTRRPGFPIPSRWAHAWRRTGDLAHTLKTWTRLYFVMQDAWLATRTPSALEKNLLHGVQVQWEQMRCYLAGLGDQAPAAWDAVSSRFANNWEALCQYVENLQTRVYELNLSERLSEEWQDRKDTVQQLLSEIRYNLSLLTGLQYRVTGFYKRYSQTMETISKVNPFSIRQFTGRKKLDIFWHKTRAKMAQGRWHQVNYPMVVVNLLRDIKLNIRFVFAIASGNQ